MAPDFTLNDLDGKPFRMSDTKGNVVILDFWATWCPPCRMEIPHFEALYRQYRANGLEIVGVALDRGGAKVVKPFVKDAGVTYPVVIGDQATANAYGGIRGIPTTFIIDRQGRIVEKAVGYRDKAFFESRIKELL
jgi:cytochrome c biogenesis protein CcmG/thiol:disulfide interchange protein DsbE